MVCPIYNCDEDTLPVVVDLLKIFNEPVSNRKERMEEVGNAIFICDSPCYGPRSNDVFSMHALTHTQLLRDAPSDCSGIIARVVSEMARIDLEHQAHEQEHDEKAHK